MPVSPSLAETATNHNSHHYLSNLLCWLHIPTLGISVNIFIFPTNSLPASVSLELCVSSPKRLKSLVFELLENEQVRPKPRCPCFHYTFLPIHLKLFEYSLISRIFLHASLLQMLLCPMRPWQAHEKQATRSYCQEGAEQKGGWMCGCYKNNQCCLI